MLEWLKRIFRQNKVYASLSEENLPIKSDANAASYYLKKEEKSVSDLANYDKDKKNVLLAIPEESEEANEGRINHHPNKNKFDILQTIQEEIEETKGETGIRNPSFTQLENQKNKNLFVK